MLASGAANAAASAERRVTIPSSVYALASAARPISSRSSARTRVAARASSTATSSSTSTCCATHSVSAPLPAIAPLPPTTLRSRTPHSHTTTLPLTDSSASHFATSTTAPGAFLAKSLIACVSPNSVSRAASNRHHALAPRLHHGARRQAERAPPPRRPRRRRSRDGGERRARAQGPERRGRRALAGEGGRDLRGVALGGGRRRSSSTWG